MLNLVTNGRGRAGAAYSISIRVSRYIQSMNKTGARIVGAGHNLQETSPTSRPVQTFAAAAREYHITYMTTTILLGESEV